MASRQELLTATVKLIADYRASEIPELDAEHVARWVQQFPSATQEPILEELAHVLGKTYFTKKAIIHFLANVVIPSRKFAGDDPCGFWRGVRFLELQTAGNSQRDMLRLFEAALQAKCGLSLNDCGAEPHTYVYLDDALFSGGRIKSDIVTWIRESAPTSAKVAVITIGIHRLGEWFATKDISQAARDAGKKIDVQFWCAMRFEDRKAYITSSDVLRPTAIPEDAATQLYVKELGATPILRPPGGAGEIGVFSSEAGRSLLEQEFLKAGVKVRTMCPYLNKYMRPLGNTTMKTLGFGSTIVTYRNCPNNAPLVLWAGDPWYPLFPRKTN